MSIITVYHLLNSLSLWQVDDPRCWNCGRFFWDIYPAEIREFQTSTRLEYSGMELLSFCWFQELWYWLILIVYLPAYHINISYILLPKLPYTIFTIFLLGRPRLSLVYISILGTRLPKTPL